MGYLNPMRGSVKVQLADDYWVVLRHLKLEESDDFENIKDETDKAVAGLVAAAVDWNLDDEDGRKFDRSELMRVFKEMPQGDFVKLSVAFAKNEGMSEEELEATKESARMARVNFREPGERRNPDEQARPADPPGVPAAPDAVGTAGDATGAHAPLAQ
jgi:hypothetical protein